MSSQISLRTSLSGTPFNAVYVKELSKLTLRAALHPRQTRDWLHFLNSHPLAADLVQAYPRLIYKIYRPYLSNTLDCAGRLAVLTSHYRFVIARGWGPIVAQAARAPVPLCTLGGKSGAHYAIRMGAIAPMECEGELIFQLTGGADVIYSAVFSFFEAPEGMCVGVGCTKGPKGGDALEVLRETTRDLHGLHPKKMMVRLIRQLGHDTGCRDMLLVANQNRPARYAIRQGLVFADYDTLWEDLGAARRADGDYLLPCNNFSMPDMERIPQKKRSEARKRHELLKAVLHAVSERLDTRCAAPAAPGVHAQSAPAAKPEQTLQ